MGLKPISIEPEAVDIPSAILDLIDRAWQRTQVFLASNRERPVKGFQPSDFEEAYRWLKTVRSFFPQDVKPDLCEWGSGLGVVSVLAQHLDYEVTAIESNPGLFQAGLAWQDSEGIPIRACQGSFIPSKQLGLLKKEWDLGLLGSPGATDSMWLDLESESIYQRESFCPDSFDVIYAYPWPGEELFLFHLFEVIARPKTYLLTFHGAADFRLHQKQKDRQNSEP